MPRVAIAGFQHETNTFAPQKGSFDRFVEADGWPGLTRGVDLLANLKGYNIGVTGLIEGAQELGWDIAPMTWAYGGAGGTVTHDAFEKITHMILDDLGKAGPVDGILLDLHGAMVSEEYWDGEGELLKRIRTQCGWGVPIVACLDLHANITQAMVDLSDQLIVYRTYPHLDMAESGRQAAYQLDRIFSEGKPKHQAFLQIPFLIPMTSGCTLVEPAKGTYEKLRELEKQLGVTHMSFACGFSQSDFPDCGPSVLAYGNELVITQKAATDLYQYVLKHEGEFAPKLWQTKQAVSYAISRSKTLSKPIILADVQDNYGGGASSDSNGILAELVNQNALNAVIGVLWDPEVAEAAHRAGIGESITIGIGGKSGYPGHEPFEATYKVEALYEGLVQTTGVYFAGGLMDLGIMALLRIGDIRIVVASKADQAADQAMFTVLGVDPKETSILVLKSSVHFRADFQSIAAEVIEVASPAPVLADISHLDFKNLRPNVRLIPKG
ncbi:M81 family metallopeptidase [Curvivirga sp.]|uniref:M81 family metallopeptidase n=1 Tax=Curvivirga sp. TaxID=2856848 RepID=UPI003B59C2A9